jgi:short-subunit dehydrogenase
MEKEDELRAGASTEATLLAPETLACLHLWRRHSRTDCPGTSPGGTALVTGASSGIGAEFARQLAERGYNLILVARRLERLERLSAELADRYDSETVSPRRDCAAPGLRIRTEALTADLADPVSLHCLEKRVAGLTDLALIVNSAGFGTAGSFASVPPERQMEMIAVHITAPVHLCRAALPGMISRRRGALINVASVAAFIPLPGNVLYCATKAAMVSFSEALQTELKGSGVRVQALCPGFTRTELHDRSGMESYRSLPGFVWSSPEKVVAESLKSLDGNNTICVPGTVNRAIVGLARIGLIPFLVRMLIHLWYDPRLGRSRSV